jgi:hypothetical protein
MRALPSLALAGVLAVALTTAQFHALATEYFVAKHGDDTHPGTDRATAWATIQKGVNKLQPGDTLTIEPGEYFEGVKRTALGSADRETIIRAEVPGTVLLRGDIPAPAFRPLAGHRFVYEADFDFAGDVPAVNEIDTLTILKRMPNSSELEFVPGTFFHDVSARKLYLATSDMKPPEAHHYSVSVIPTHGLSLVNPQRVVVEGLAATGFSAMALLHYREGTSGGVWGFFLLSARNCVVRDCRAYLNAWGIGLNSSAPGSGNNVFERCVAWGNKSAFANGDMGGLTLFGARRDVIRDSTAFRNGMYGINIYGTGGAPPGVDDGGNDPKNRSLLSRNLSWGNETADLKVKTGYEYFHVVENCVGLGLWSAINVTRGLSGRVNAKNKDHASDSIALDGETTLVQQQEFADPDHHDYRLQATSRFRGTGPDGQDRGPFPYQPNIFYVRQDGDDAADGLSVARAWKTFGRAVRDLRAGDTLYLEPGDYAASPDLHVQGAEGAPIAIRGRGRGPVILRGVMRVAGCERVNFNRLSFLDEVTATKSNEVAFDNCEFRGVGTALEATNVSGLKISHCIFTRFQNAALALTDCSRADLSGNLYNNTQSHALRLNSAETIRYSNYNSYQRASTAWEVNGKIRAWPEVHASHEQQSQELTPELTTTGEAVRLKNAALFSTGGPFGKPIGRYEDEPRREELRLAAKPVVHSVSATTANLEWMTSLPATCQLAWGETPACEHAATFNVNCFGTYSLTGLKPGQTYFFRIKAIETPKDMLPKTEAQAVAVTDEPISFATLARNPAPATYYVAPDGSDTSSGLDRQNAWQTIRHAAARVNVSDTVLLARGKYSERVRLRATGEQGSPITFRALPGERVELDGGNGVLPNAFIVGGKNHLRFDGFYFANFNLFPNDSWSLLNCGEFQLYAGHDIAISRCFSDGRGGYSAIPIAAFEVENLTVKNCVNTNKFGGMYFWRCPNLVIEHTVFASPMINSFVLRNAKDQPATMERCIFTDMLEKKAKLNIGLLCCDGAIDSFHQRNNAYFLRCFPTEERALNGNKPIGLLRDHIHEPVFADPLFAGDPGVAGHPADKSGFGPDRMMELALKLDFDSYFSNNPELIQRGIGLQREAFQDYNFTRPPAPSK